MNLKLIIIISFIIPFNLFGSTSPFFQLGVDKVQISEKENPTKSLIDTFWGASNTTFRRLWNLDETQKKELITSVLNSPFQFSKNLLRSFTLPIHKSQTFEPEELLEKYFWEYQKNHICPHFKDFCKYGTANIFWKRDSLGNITKAPMIIALTGLFESIEDPPFSGLIHHMSHLGYHVLTFANSTSIPYMSKYPKQNVFDLVTDAEFRADIVTSFLYRYSYLVVGGANLLGLSLGAFELPALILSLKRKNIELGKSLILHPVISISKSLARADAYKNAFKSLPNQFSGELINLFMKADLPWAVYLERNRNKYLTNKGIKNDDNLNLRKLPRLNSLGFQKWFAELNFETAFTLYFPWTLKNIINSKLGNFSYWIQRLKKEDYNEFLVVTTTNDPLNEKRDWWKSGLVGLLRHKLVMKKGGGHHSFSIRKEINQFF